MYNKIIRVDNVELVDLLKKSQHHVKVHDPDALPEHHAVRSRIAFSRKTGKALYSTRIDLFDLEWLQTHSS